MPHTEQLDRDSGGPVPGRRQKTTDPAMLAELLDEWMRGDEAEQRVTFEALRRALDEDRPAGYKLFS